MTIRELAEKADLEILAKGFDGDAEVTDVFCCDLLSLAMSRGKRSAAWITVMGNVNTLAVAKLTEMNPVVLAEGVAMDEETLQKAKEQDIWILSSGESVFSCALKIHDILTAGG